MIGLIFIGAGLIGCALVVLTTEAYTQRNGDKYGAARDTRKEGLCVFGTPLVIGVIISIIEWFL